MSLLNKPVFLHTDGLHSQDSETHKQTSVAKCDHRWFNVKDWGAKWEDLGFMIKCREKTAKATVLSNDSLEKTPIDGKGRRQEEKGATEDEMVGWHH